MEVGMLRPGPRNVLNAGEFSQLQLTRCGAATKCTRANEAWRETAFPLPPMSLPAPTQHGAACFADAPTLARFSPWIGGEFLLQPAGGPAVAAILIEATSLGHRTNRALQAGRESFRLLFRGPRDWWPHQQIFHVASDRAGDFGDIFMVPVGLDEHGMQLEAIFNLT